jgi:hypothetical protein
MKSCVIEIHVKVVCIAPVQNSVYAILRFYYVRYFIMVYNLLFEHFVEWIPRFKVFMSIDWMKDYYCRVSFQFYNL